MISEREIDRDRERERERVIEEFKKKKNKLEILCIIKVILTRAKGEAGVFRQHGKEM